MRNVPIFCDSDGVLVNFELAALKLIGRPYRSMPPEDAWAYLEKVACLFANMELMPDAKELWAGIAQYTNHALLTATPRPTGELWSAPRDKRELFRKHFSATAPVLVSKHGCAKWLFASPGAVLIDDMARNIQAWEAAGGKGILHVNAQSSLRELHSYMAG